MSEQTAYIVTSGSYSDYCIRRVYLDEAEALKYVQWYNAKHKYDDAGIEEWPIGPEGYFTGTVYSIRDYGDVRGEQHWTYELDGPEQVPQAEVLSAVIVADKIMLHVRGTSEEHVAKAFRDNMARLKAEQAGVA